MSGNIANQRIAVGSIIDYFRAALTMHYTVPKPRRSIGSLGMPSTDQFFHPVVVVDSSKRSIGICFHLGRPL